MMEVVRPLYVPAETSSKDTTMIHVHRSSVPGEMLRPPPLTLSVIEPPNVTIMPGDKPQKDIAAVRYSD